jgi:hypothetical protein
VTKTANPTAVLAPGGSVVFTFVVTNNSAESVTLTSLTDDRFGDLNGQGTCATGGTIVAGGSYTCSVTKTINGDGGTSHVNVVTAIATDNEGTTDSATDDATVTIVSPTGQITPTGTTCEQFSAGTAADLTQVLYTVKGQKINSVAPGVFFYYSAVTVDPGTHTISVSQTTSPNFTLFGVQQDQAVLYNSNCVRVQNNATGTFTVTNDTGGPVSYVIGIKYDPNTVVGKTKPGGNGNVTYTFTTSIDGTTVASSPDSLVLKQKPKG